LIAHTRYDFRFYFCIGDITMFAIIGWILFGLVVGLIARLLVPGRQAMGMLATILLGIVGSLIGGAIAWIWHGGHPDMYQPSGWIMSVIGAILCVVIASRMGRTA